MGGESSRRLTLSASSSVVSDAVLATDELVGVDLLLGELVMRVVERLAPLNVLGFKVMELTTEVGTFAMSSLSPANSSRVILEASEDVGESEGGSS